MSAGPSDNKAGSIKRKSEKEQLLESIRRTQRELHKKERECDKSCLMKEWKIAKDFSHEDDKKHSPKKKAEAKKIRSLLLDFYLDHEEYNPEILGFFSSEELRTLEKFERKYCKDNNIHFESIQKDCDFIRSFVNEGIQLFVIDALCTKQGWKEIASHYAQNQYELQENSEEYRLFLKFASKAFAIFRKILAQEGIH